MKNPTFILRFALCLFVSIPVGFHAQTLPPIQAAGNDGHGHFTVNGKPFFPILMYDVPTDAASLKMLHEQGFNAVPVAKPEDVGNLLAAGFYGAAHPGLKPASLDAILFGIAMDSPALNFADKVIEQTKADLDKVQKEYPGRPVMNAIGYWANEPDGVKAGTLLPKEKYEDLIQAIDVAAPYLYPVPYQPISSVGDAVGKAVATTGGKKPVLPILQLFVWDAKDRYPTPAELKCMVYISLIQGAGGIGYYSYGYVSGKTETNIAKEQPELWKAVKDINTEVGKIGRFMALAQTDTTVTLKEGAPDVEFRAMKVDGASPIGEIHAGMVLLANKTNAAKSATIKFASKADGTLKRLDGGAAVTIQGNEAKIALEPNQAVGLQW